MLSVNEILAGLTSQRKPLADRRQHIAITYRTELAAVNSQLKPINRAITALTPKTPKEPKAPKAPKKGAKAVAK